MPEGISVLLEHDKATNGRLDQVDRRLDQVDRSLDGIDRNIVEVKEDIDGLGEAHRRELQAQSSFRGNYAQSAATADDIEIAALFAHLYGLTRIVTGQVGRAVLTTWLRENSEEVEALGLRPRAWRTFLRPDVIVGVKDLYADRSADPEFYIVVEASYTAEAEDVLKVTDHAKIVRTVTGRDAYPVVSSVRLDDETASEIGHRLYDDVGQFIEAKDADTAFWYRLDSADLRPSEPR